MALSEKTKILLYGSNIWYFGEGMFGPLFAVFSQRLGGSLLDLTGAWASYLIVAGVLNILIGKLSDLHIKKEKLMVAGYGLNAFFTFSYLFVNSPGDLFFTQAGLGVAAALAAPTWLALYDKHSGKTTRNDGFVWGLMNGETQIIVGVAIVIGGLIVSYGSFTALFVTMGTIQIIATLYQAKILKN